MRAYLHFGKAPGPFQTIEVPAKETERPWKGRTASGYGAQLPTPYLVQWAGKWRRVYAACWSNAASHYIGKPGAWLATVQIEKESRA